MSEPVHLGCIFVGATPHTLDGDQLADLARVKREELLLLCPSLRTLKWSRLEVVGREVDGKARIDFWCLELDAATLGGIFGPGRDLLPSEPKSFGEEAGRVVLAIDDVRRQLSLATSVTITREALRGGGVGKNLELRAAADKLRRKAVGLPSKDGKRSVVVSEVPQYLPHGSKIRVSAYVLSLRRRSAELVGVRFVPSEHAPTGDLLMPQQMTLQRKTVAQFAAHGPALLHAMENDLKVLLDVVLLCDWVDSQPSVLDLVEVLEPSSDPVIADTQDGSASDATSDNV